ncbi:MAG: hypothetical protein VYE18_05540 [Pseudomonadota bacterium]|nr:hypothetical protein [Pseudomonadota bacterium]
MYLLTEELGHGHDKPLHPGAILREKCLALLGYITTECDRTLEVGRQALSALVNQRACRFHRNGLPVVETLRLDA